MSISDENALKTHGNSLVKKMNCVMFGIVVPIVYLSEVEADCFVLFENK